ncbi:hypothetical protein OAB57_03670, partial [Bacteriovoracaceae bacterium]|nr:hypothetical protein [Bacteriovoracaceae bacterium]
YATSSANIGSSQIEGQISANTNIGKDAMAQYERKDRLKWILLYWVGLIVLANTIFNSDSESENIEVENTTSDNLTFAGPTATEIFQDLFYLVDELFSHTSLLAFPGTGPTGCLRNYRVFVPLLSFGFNFRTPLLMTSPNPSISSYLQLLTMLPGVLGSFNLLIKEFKYRGYSAAKIVHDEDPSPNKKERMDNLKKKVVIQPKIAALMALAFGSKSAVTSWGLRSGDFQAGEKTQLAKMVPIPVYLAMATLSLYVGGIHNEQLMTKSFKDIKFDRTFVQRQLKKLTPKIIEDFNSKVHEKVTNLYLKKFPKAGMVDQLRQHKRLMKMRVPAMVSFGLTSGALAAAVASGDFANMEAAPEDIMYAIGTGMLLVEVLDQATNMKRGTHLLRQKLKMSSHSKPSQSSKTSKFGISSLRGSKRLPSKESNIVTTDFEVDLERGIVPIKK